MGAPPSGAGRTPEPPRSLRTPARAALLATAAVFVVAFGISQLPLLFGRALSSDESLALTLGLDASLLGVAVVAARLARRPLRDYGFVLRGPAAPVLVFSALLVLVFLVVDLYPGFLFGFGRYPPLPVLAFGFALFSAPIVALGQEALFRGYVFRTLSRAVPLATALAFSATYFALTTTNFLDLPSLGEVAGGEYLFGTTVANLVLGLVLGLLCYKGRWGLLGSFATRTGLLWVGTLVPVAANFTSWETSFAVLLLGYGVLLVVVAFALREPRLQAHAYLREPIGPRRLRFRERARSRREVRGGVVAVAALAIVFVGATQLAPIALGASPPLLAIASGSMEPTFYRGTLVVLEHATPANVHVGTIIAFHVSCLPSPTVHRVYRIVQGGSSPVYQTKGDANPSPDPCPVPFADVLGRVVAHVPYLGLLVLDPLLDGAIVVLIILAALLAPRRKR